MNESVVLSSNNQEIHYLLLYPIVSKQFFHFLTFTMKIKAKIRWGLDLLHSSSRHCYHLICALIVRIKIFHHQILCQEIMACSITKFKTWLHRQTASLLNMQVINAYFKQVIKQGSNRTNKRTLPTLPKNNNLYLFNNFLFFMHINHPHQNSFFTVKTKFSKTTPLYYIANGN